MGPPCMWGRSPLSHLVRRPLAPPVFAPMPRCRCAVAATHSHLLPPCCSDHSVTLSVDRGKVSRMSAFLSGKAREGGGGGPARARAAAAAAAGSRSAGWGARGRLARRLWRVLSVAGAHVFPAVDIRAPLSLPPPCPSPPPLPYSCPTASSGSCSTARWCRARRCRPGRSCRWAGRGGARGRRLWRRRAALHGSCVSRRGMWTRSVPPHSEAGGTCCCYCSRTEQQNSKGPALLLGAGV